MLDFLIKNAVNFRFMMADTRTNFYGTPIRGGQPMHTDMTLPSTSPLNILVVEDNNDFRELLCEMLELLGHSVVSEATAEKALQAFNANAIHLVISDITLPGMSGIELAKRMHALQPEVRIILSSGYGLPIGTQLDFKIGLLSKPYSFKQLTQALVQITPLQA